MTAKLGRLVVADPGDALDVETMQVVHPEWRSHHAVCKPLTPHKGVSGIHILRRVWRAAPVATVILSVAIAVSVFFAVRLVAFWLYWADPAHQDQAIEGWMTPGYVAHSWDVPRRVTFGALDLSPQPGKPMTLKEIAQARGVSVEELTAELRAEIAAHRSEADRP